MIKETCNKCGEEVIEDRKLDNNVWNCPSCGLEDYQSRHISKEEANKFGLKNSIKPNKDGSNPRLNNKEFINSLLKVQHNFQLGNTQNIDNIRNTIPEEYLNDFNYGFTL